MTYAAKYEGMIVVNTQGRTFEVIRYFDSSTIKVKFKDGGDEVFTSSGGITKRTTKHPREKQLEFEGTKWINSNNENFTILKYSDSKNVLVQYEDKVQATYSIQKIKLGQVRHPKHGNRIPSNVIDVMGMKITNGKGLVFEIISQDYNKVEIRFENTGTIKWVNKENAMAGKVMDQFHCSVMGIGYLGNYDKDLAYAERAYKLWKDMLDRCYGTKEQHICYAQVEVSKPWKCFELFLNDISKIKGFNMWLTQLNIDLDKDLLSGKSKKYSLETCCFLTHADNIRIIGKGSEKHGAEKFH